MKRINKSVIRSNKAHLRLEQETAVRNEVVTSMYHYAVRLEQHKQNRVISQIEKQKIFNRISKTWGKN